MIFIAKNENGEYTWELILTKEKTVTSRVSPIDVDKTFAVQPGRGKKAVCRAKVVSCINRLQHYQQQSLTHDGDIASWKQKEAELEGFKSWDGLMRYFQKNNINFMELYRIEFELIDEEEMMKK